MKWKFKQSGGRPQDFQERTIKVFAIVPLKTEDGVWVWLEYVHVDEMYFQNRWIEKRIYQL